MAQQQKNDRIKGYDWFEKAGKSMIIVGGAGGIGSYITFYLSRLNVKAIYLYDFDKVEEHNLAGQLFSNFSIGKFKTDEVKDLCGAYANSNVASKVEEYGETSLIGPYMFSCFDNMAARKTMFNNWKSYMQNNDEGIFIDGRMLMEGYHVFGVTKDNMDEYEENHLPSDNDVPDLPCTQRGVSYIGGGIASTMVQLFVNYLSKDNMKSIPFCIKHYGDIFKTDVYESVCI